MSKVYKTIKQLIADRGDPNASSYSGCDEIDMIRIAENFQRNHPDEIKKLIEDANNYPSRPDRMGDNLVYALKFIS